METHGVPANLAKLWITTQNPQKKNTKFLLTWGVLERISSRSGWWTVCPWTTSLSAAAAPAPCTPDAPVCPPAASRSTWWNRSPGVYLLNKRDKKRFNFKILSKVTHPRLIQSRFRQVAKFESPKSREKLASYYTPPRWWRIAPFTLVRNGVSTQTCSTFDVFLASQRVCVCVYARWNKIRWGFWTWSIS